MLHFPTRVSHAEAVASLAHHNQVRAYTGAPYIEHPRNVVLKVMTITGDPDILSAAWLHDAVKDTDITMEQIEDWFNPRVARIVWELTGKPTGAEAQTIRVCEIVDDMEHVAANDPEYAAVCLPEMLSILITLDRADEYTRDRAIEGCLALILEQEL